MRRRVCKALPAPGPSGAPPPGRGRRNAGPCVMGAAMALSLAGCGIPIITFPADPPAEAPTMAPEPVSTGSIDKRPKSFGGNLTDEDWRRAHAALSVALDPQGNGRPVKWDNPDSGLRGSVNPTGLPYVANDVICRDFLASVIAPARSRFIRGTGCKPSGGEWELTRIRTAKAAP